MNEKLRKCLIDIFYGLWNLLILLSLISIITFTFWKINIVARQIIWYLSSALFISSCFNKNLINGKMSNKCNNILDIAFVIAILAIFGGIFVIKTYETNFNWHWYAFVMIGVLASCGTACFAVLDWERSDKSIKEKKEIIDISSKVLSYACLVDLFYLSLFIGNLTFKFIIEIIFVAFMLYSLAGAFVTSSFMRKAKLAKCVILVEFVSLIVLTILLIDMIPEDYHNIQTIASTIVAAVYGGLLTLVGVAWTIRKGEKDRRNDLKQRDKEKAEDERRRYVPYIRLIRVGKADCFSNASVTNSIELHSLSERCFFAYTINDFNIKNISESNVILVGVKLNDKLYSFSNDNIIEKNTVCNIQTTRNFEYASEKPLKELSIVLEDIVGNKYEVICNLDYKPENPMLVSEKEDEENTITMFRGTYTVDSFSLPRLIVYDNFI